MDIVYVSLVGPGTGTPPDRSGARPSVGTSMGAGRWPAPTARHDEGYPGRDGRERPGTTHRTVRWVGRTGRRGVRRCEARGWLPWVDDHRRVRRRPGGDLHLEGRRRAPPARVRDDPRPLPGLRPRVVGQRRAGPGRRAAGGLGQDPRPARGDGRGGGSPRPDPDRPGRRARHRPRCHRHRRRLRPLRQAATLHRVERGAWPVDAHARGRPPLRAWRGRRRLCAAVGTGGPGGGPGGGRSARPLRGPGRGLRGERQPAPPTGPGRPGRPHRHAGPGDRPRLQRRPASACGSRPRCAVH